MASKQAPKRAKAKRPAHRPSLYHTKVKPKLERIKKETARGATREEIAALCGVSVRTLAEHANQFSQLSQALHESDLEACELVKAAMFRRAIGYTHPAVRFISVSQGDGQGSVVEKHEYVEHYPPDTSAGQFFLCNRDPEHWKQKVEHAQDENRPWTVEVVNYSGASKKP